ncbi:MAG: efflux RND transporter periplasmic adaptor subunit [bacterium]|nr:efflux RND transporter periplasmic adaptor subunit [bacterium]
MPVFKKKKFYIILAVVILVVGGSVYAYRQKTKQTTSYETVKVERGSLAQTVDATGKIKAAEDLSLHFETSGTVDKVNVKEGGVVKAGDRLANLRLSELDASVAQAQANLNQKLAGSTKEEIDYYKAAAQIAQVDKDKALQDGVTAVAAAESAMETAKNNLKLTEGGENSQIVSNSYENAIALFPSVLSSLDNGLTQADNILGIDNTTVNDGFEEVLSVLDSSKLRAANTYYATAKEGKAGARAQILPLTAQSSHSDVDAALIKAESVLSQMNQLLLSVKDALEATQLGSVLSQSSLDTKKTAVETARTDVAAKYTSVISQRQAIAEAKNSYEKYKIAYEKAVRDLQDTKTTAENTVKIKQAAYEQAVANLSRVNTPAREVDVAPYRAALAQAVANRDKAIIHAPIDGTITEISKKKGELILSSEVMIKLLSPNFEIEVDIPETDIAKLKIKDEVEITLDAFGDDIKFKGQVLSIDPASTEIQDVVYYQVRISIEAGVGDVKPGMTANVVIGTEKRDDVLYIPYRAVLSKTDTWIKYARVLKDNRIEEREVKLGLRGDDGKVEVLEGLQKSEEIVVRVKE